MGCGASSALDDAQRRIVRLEAAIADMEKKTQAQAQVQPTSTNSADPDDNQRAQSQQPKAAKPAAAASGSADNEHVHPFGGEQSNGGTVEEPSLSPSGIADPFNSQCPARVCVCRCSEPERSGGARR